MTIPVTTEGVLFIIAIASVLFNIFLYFKKPQDKQEKDSLTLSTRLDTLQREVIELRQTHLATLEKDVKDLNITIQNLGITVAKLSTIIDERIPKGAALTQTK